MMVDHHRAKIEILYIVHMCVRATSWEIVS